MRKAFVIKKGKRYATNGSGFTSVIERAAIYPSKTDANRDFFEGDGEKIVPVTVTILEEKN